MEHVSDKLQDRVYVEVQRYIELANRAYNKKFSMPRIAYNVRGGTAGTANAGQWIVRFNPVLLNENVQYFIEDTIPHEVAHLIDHAVHPFKNMGRRKGSSHGATWKAVMRTFGIDNPTRCHRLNTVSSRVKYKTIRRHIYKCVECNDKEFTLGPKHHSALHKKPWLEFTIRSCGHKLSSANFVRTVVVATGEERKRLHEQKMSAMT